jgi:hypothetical protein
MEIFTPTLTLDTRAEYEHVVSHVYEGRGNVRILLPTMTRRSLANVSRPNSHGCMWQPPKLFDRPVEL